MATLLQEKLLTGNFTRLPCASIEFSLLTFEAERDQTCIRDRPLSTRACWLLALSPQPRRSRISAPRRQRRVRATFIRVCSILPICFVAKLINHANKYIAGNTPCVAAHSTTRALYGAYNGGLYQLIRGSDNQLTDVHPLSAGGVANAGTQDSFCQNTTCLINVIYDQSGHNNHLSRAPPGGFNGPDVNNFDYLAGATGAPVMLNGRKAYGVFGTPGTGYRNDQTTGVATGDGAEGIYAVVDGTHFNGACCYDYGNAEVSAKDTGMGHMEAIYFGDNADYGTGAGSGPWVLADLENGLYDSSSHGENPNNPSTTDRFVTAIVKGAPNNQWSVRGGNAQTGSLTTYWDGARPSGGYNPMSKEGAIILGIGGDNSNGGQGTFYEGVMTASYPSDDTENKVQANIVAAGYAIAPLTSGPGLTVGNHVSLKATTACCTTRYVAHTGSTVNTQVVSGSSPLSLKQQASWIVHTGLGNSGCFSFESVDTPGSYVRHSGFELYLNANDNSKQFAEDATFCTETSFNSLGTNSLRSWNYPAHFWRHYNAIMYAASNGGPKNFDATALFNDDASFVIGTGFA